MTKKFKVELQNVMPVGDNKTFRATAFFPESSASSPTAFRKYTNLELARYIYDFSRRVNNKYVARSKFLDVANDGSSARLFFVPFYKYSFVEWADIVAQETKAVRVTSFKKAFRSVVIAIDSIYEHHRYDIGLKTCIRIDEHQNAQIVLDSKGTVSMKDGVPEDIIAFKQLVDDVIAKIKRKKSVGYKYFCRLNRHFSQRTDVLADNGSLRSYAYFMFHNPLFYEVEDTCNCISKLAMFRDWDMSLFDNKMSQNTIKEIAKWTTEVCKKQFLEEIFLTRPGPGIYNSDITILKFYFNCYDHGQNTGLKGVFQVQKELDGLFPNAVHGLLYHFVTEIEVMKVFQSVPVLEYFRRVHPSPNFLR